jgi:regulator of sigma E protease
VTIKRGDEAMDVRTVFIPPSDKEKNASKAAYVKIKYQYGFPIWATQVFAGAPAYKAVLKPNDTLLDINGKKIDSSKMFIKEVASSKGNPVTILIERHGKKITKTVTPRQVVTGDIGIRLVWIDHPPPWHQCERVVKLTYKSISGIIAGMFGKSTLKPSHLSGPVGIFNGIAVTFAKRGIMPALSLIVLISYSLAFLNIMPIPVLDGGHIVMAIYEAIFKKPMSPKIVQPVFMLAIASLISLMLYVTFHDFARMMSETKRYRFIPASLAPAPIPAESKGKLEKNAKGAIVSPQEKQKEAVK